MSDKIRSQHLQRKAILYVRQSSAYQVSHNLESQRLQYAMQERLQQLGWREIEVVDEDLAARESGPPAPTKSVGCAPVNGWMTWAQSPFSCTTGSAPLAG